ncbi:hypothetical protein DSO57_1019172 [Entomophthora muscae]|uniref:Uncharacterized protein n=1 Tax=Entomophthora muscae TaxID=34485 RepID=A0ACC2TRB2_9FUNG|nr:hypothetical protein DSO57_1019172 [Entomophthora muscae]
MIYGYIQKCNDTGLELISPKQMLEINLSSSALSTFILSGTRLTVFKWLAEHESVEVKVEDPLEPSRVPTTTIEIRRKANFFFSRCYIIMRPTISADMLLETPAASDPALDSNFRLPLVKKLILPTRNSFKEILQYIKLGNAHPSIVKSMTKACPSSYYDPSLTELTVKTTRDKEKLLEHKKSYSNSLSDSKPRLPTSSDSEAPLNREAKLYSPQLTSSDTKPQPTNIRSLPQKPLTRSSTMNSFRPGLRNKNSPEPAFLNYDQKPYSVAKRAIIKCEYGVRRTRSLAK